MKVAGFQRTAVYRQVSESADYAEGSIAKVNSIGALRKADGDGKGQEQQPGGQKDEEDDQQ